MELISIQRLSGELNISSRALRHYEKEGLIESYRNNKIRYYSKEMIHKIKIIILFR